MLIIKSYSLTEPDKEITSLNYSFKFLASFNQFLFSDLMSNMINDVAHKPIVLLKQATHGILLW